MEASTIRYECIRIASEVLRIDGTATDAAKVVAYAGALENYILGGDKPTLKAAA